MIRLRSRIVVVYFLFWIYNCLCDDEYLNVYYVKHSKSFASKERVLLNDGYSDISDKYVFEDNRDDRVDFKVMASRCNQVTVSLLKKYSTPWEYGSYITVYGAYDNIVYQAHYQSSKTERNPVSFCYGVFKGSEYKYYISLTYISSAWFKPSFDDSGWDSIETNVVYDPNHHLPVGTHYFRRKFRVDASGYSAFEMQIRYQEGIVVYMNGNEIYRDNMKEGIVKPDTEATGSYQTVAYRGCIRSMHLLNENTDNTIAVEFHWIKNDITKSMPFMMDSWIGYYYPTADSSCYVYPQRISVSVEDVPVTTMSDMDVSTYYSFSSEYGIIHMDLGEVPVKPFINQLSLYSPFNTYSLPFYLWVSTQDSQTIDLYDSNGFEYQSSAYSHFPLYNRETYYKIYNIALSEEHIVSIFEIRMEICNRVYTELSYALAQPCDDSNALECRYKGYMKDGHIMLYSSITEMVLRPVPTVAKNCTVVEGYELPSGLLLVGCQIEGIAFGVGTFVFRIRSLDLGLETSDIIVESILCNRMYLYLRMYYSHESKGMHETFSVCTKDDCYVNHTIQDTLRKSKDSTIGICGSYSVYTITMGSSEKDYWEKGSKFTFFMKLHDREIVLYEGRYDARLGMDNSVTINLEGPILDTSYWYYIMGYIPKESDWITSTNYQKWSYSRYNSFPISPNQIQLYKKAFYISTAQASSTKSLLLYLSYHQGVLIYINGHEAFRYFINDKVLTNSTFSSSSVIVNEILYITIPVGLACAGRSCAANIHAGDNMITIANIANEPNQRASVFDCFMYVQAEEEFKQNYKVTSFFTGDTTIDLLGDDYSSLYTASSCAEQSYYVYSEQRLLHVNELRLYWNNGSTPTLLPIIELYGNKNDGRSTLIGNSTYVYSPKYPAIQHIYINQMVFCTEYRIRILSSPLSCNWGLRNIRLIANYRSIVHQTVYGTILFYLGNNEKCYLPVNPSFYHITISSLPDGIFLDSFTNCLYGTPTRAGTTHAFVTAMHINGNRVEETITITVTDCEAPHAMLVNVLSYAGVNSQLLDYTITRKSDNSVILTRSIRSYNYVTSSVSVCLPSNVYIITFTAVTSPWSPPSSYSIIASSTFHSQAILSGAITNMEHKQEEFSTYVQLHSLVSQWSYLYTEELNITWYAVDYDYSSWGRNTLNNLPSEPNRNLYLRNTFIIESYDISDYLLTIIYSYAANVYVNGVLKASLSIKTAGAHIANSASIPISFGLDHLISGLNYIAIVFISSSNTESEFRNKAEMKSITSSEYSMISPFTLLSSSIPMANLFNPCVSESTPFELEYGAEVIWTGHNEIPYVFNHLHMRTSSINALSFVLYGTNDMVTKVSAQAIEWHELLRIQDERMEGYGIIERWVNNGLFGWISFRLVFLCREADHSKLTVYQLSLALISASTTTTLCEATSRVKSVYEGWASPVLCETPYHGFAYYECKNGSFSTLNASLCIISAPTRLTYPSLEKLAVGATLRGIAPSHDSAIDIFTVSPFLPLGLSIDPISGSINGIVQYEMKEPVLYTIRGSNRGGVISFPFNISSYYASCPNDGSWKEVTTSSAVLVSISCSLLNRRRIGIASRVCRVGMKEATWEAIQWNACYSNSVAIVLIVVLCLLISFFLNGLLKCCTALARRRHLKQLRVLSE